MSFLTHQICEWQLSHRESVGMFLNAFMLQLLTHWPQLQPHTRSICEREYTQTQNHNKHRTDRSWHCDPASTFNPLKHRYCVSWNTHSKCLSCLADVLHKLSRTVSQEVPHGEKRSLLTLQLWCGQAASDRPHYGAMFGQDITFPVIPRRINCASLQLKK